MAKSKAKAVTAEAPFAVTDWPATRVEMRKLIDIHPYPNNPRTHSAEQVKLIAQSMMDDGVFMPILVDEKSIIIAGHGRRLGALENKFAEYPVVIASGWSVEKKRAVRIKDNQLGLLSGWDEHLLHSELGELQLGGYEMPLLGFSDKQLSEMIIEPSLAQSNDPELTKEQTAIFNKAWRVLLNDWKAHAERSKQLGFVSTNYTRGAMLVYFTRALIFGDDIPRAATTAYNPHRIFQAGSHNKPYLDLFDLALKQDNVLKSLQWFCGGKPAFDQMIGVTLGIQDHRPPADFPPLLARDLINEFCPKGGAVLDPCHGWGGRLLGFMLSGAGSYEGIDADAQTVKGVTQMFLDLDMLRPGRKVRLACSPFEDAKIEHGPFDFALTSPPYYDTERYGGELSSWKRYKTFDAWVGGFYKPLIEKTAAAIKPGGVFALQIGNQSYPLETQAREIIKGCDFEFIEKRATEMVNNYMGTPPEDGEIVLILRRKK